MRGLFGHHPSPGRPVFRDPLHSGHAPPDAWDSSREQGIYHKIVVYPALTARCRVNGIVAIMGTYIRRPPRDSELYHDAILVCMAGAWTPALNPAALRHLPVLLRKSKAAATNRRQNASLKYAWVYAPIAPPSVSPSYPPFIPIPVIRRIANLASGSHSTRE